MIQGTAGCRMVQRAKTTCKDQLGGFYSERWGVYWEGGCATVHKYTDLGSGMDRM